MNENRKHSSIGVLQTCTTCCPFDAKNIPHPYFNARTVDSCCLSKLQVDCRIQCPKKKKKNKQYSSSLSIQSISSASSPNPKRKKISSNDFDSQTSSSSLSVPSNTNISQQSLLSSQSRKNLKYYQKSANAQRYDRSIHIKESIQNLKTSIDNLTQLIVHHQKPSPPTSSLLDRFRRFFNFFKSTNNQLNEECCQILQRHHLTKDNLHHIYHLFDKNDTIFLNWLRTIMPEYFLPLLLNYVKNFPLISTDNN